MFLRGVTKKIWEFFAFLLMALGLICCVSLLLSSFLLGHFVILVFFARIPSVSCISTLFRSRRCIPGWQFLERGCSCSVVAVTAVDLGYRISVLIWEVVFRMCIISVCYALVAAALGFFIWSESVVSGAGG